MLLYPPSRRTHPLLTQSAATHLLLLSTDFVASRVPSQYFALYARPERPALRLRAAAHSAPTERLSPLLGWILPLVAPAAPKGREALILDNHASPVVPTHTLLRAPMQEFALPVLQEPALVLQQGGPSHVLRARQAPPRLPP